MKSPLHLFILLSCLLSGGVARAQFEIRFNSTYTKYMQYQGMEVNCSIRNISGQTIRYGGENSNIGFNLRLKDPRGKILEVQNDYKPEPFVLLSGDTYDFTIPLSRAYKLRTTGRYVLQAVFDNATHEFPSNKFFLDFEEGGTIRRSISTTTGRTYILKTMTRNEGEFLFLQVEDYKGNLVYGVYDLGRFLKFNPPQFLYDADGGFHVLHNYEPKAFAHSIFTAEGSPKARELYRESYSNVFLKMNEKGEVVVNGGIPQNP